MRGKKVRGKNMKILKDNFNETRQSNETINRIVPRYPRKHMCDNCSSELEYDKSDLHMGFLGCIHITCPLCGAENMLDTHEDSITLNKDNVEFPTHFWHTSKETGAVDCCNNKEVKECIDKAIKYFRENKDEYCWSTEYGNLYVCVTRYDDDENYDITVSDNYYGTYIPFEEEDY